VGGNVGPQVDAPGVPSEVDGPARADLSARLVKLSDRHPSSPDYADTSARSPGQRPDADDRAQTETAWRGAADKFTADWQRHREQWPRSGDQPERGKLSPEAERELAGACDKIRAAEPQITDRLRAIEADQPDRALAGLDRRLKSQERLSEKVTQSIRGKDRSISAALGLISDAIRYTFVYQASGYCDGARADIARLKADGFELLKLKNYWADRQYKGINSQWRDQQTGNRFEVQFHTTTSFEAKELIHPAYERVRDPASPICDRERRELQRLQRNVAAAVPRPRGATDIADGN
jgi:hypothetical protein